MVNLPEQSSTLPVGIFENECSDGNIDSRNSNIPRIKYVRVHIRRKWSSNGHDFDAN